MCNASTSACILGFAWVSITYVYQVHIDLGHPCQGHSVVLKCLALTSFLFPILTGSQVLCLFTLLLIFFNNSISSLQPGTQHFPLTVILILFSNSSSSFSIASSGFIFSRASVARAWHSYRAHPFLLRRAETAKK